MKKETTYAFNEKERHIIKACVNYFFHRLEKHHVTGAIDAQRKLFSKDDFNKLRQELNK